MNKTVALVVEWGQFEQKHPDGSIEDFCRHYLARQEEKKQQGPLVGGVVPPFADGLLMKIIGRISKLNMSYANMALKETNLNQIEEFGMLFTIKQEKNPKKTEVIYANLFELSSGTDMLARLIKRGLVKEYDDLEDKRSKRLEITAKGEKEIETCYAKIRKVAGMMMHELSENDKELCIQLLKNIEVKFSALWQKHRGKKFSEVYKEVVGR
ncbi:MarR family winged helix-turn-helix transcriptional regulator [Chitinophaga japonensis]|uniref:DNA-binding MarR family transcriptional regulator n=1 Tax=Chitinophaga japonensis TaxID=104662 RepID=A0A562SZT2_CHIJA|nr:winged helix DNA-binding protein [Chitinophaga japonensis]TWI86771.1 DNA-binding MarR family transcriptional regulator [Chitinophaga japonensis]